MCPISVIIFLSLIGLSVTSPTRNEKVIVSKYLLGDLEASATGFSYKQQHGLPVSFVHYTNHGSNLHNDGPKFFQFVSSLLPSSPNIYAPTFSGLDQIRALHQSNTRDAKPTVLEYKANVVAPYNFPDKENEENNEFFGNFNKNSDVGFEVESKELFLSQPNPIIYKPNFEHHGYNEYENGISKDHEIEDYEHNHDNTDIGYNGHHNYNSGEQEEHHSSNHKDNYSEEEGYDDKHTENDAYYKQEEEADKSVKGVSYGQGSFHKKGQIITGFHNVYHKDEFKQDTDFYDEEHSSGNYEKHEADDQKYNAAQRAHENISHLEDVNAHKNKEKYGQTDKDYVNSSVHNYKADREDDSHYNQHSGHGNKGDTSFSKNYRYGYGH